MGACCQSCAVGHDGMSPRYRRVLTVVLAVNATMFAVEAGWSPITGSTALPADALDFLADTLAYGLPLLSGVALLHRFHDGVANMASLWQCSRNDATGKLAVAGLFLQSSIRIVGRAWRELKQSRPGAFETSKGVFQ